MTVALAVVVCPDCAVAAHRVREGAGAYVVECVCGRVHRVRVARVYRVDPDAAPPDRAPLDRAGHAALTADDPELARIRRVLADLRPDCADPMEPPPRLDDGEDIATMRVKASRALWDVDLPHGLASGAEALDIAWALRCGSLAADVLREVDALSPDARAVLRWMRVHATLVVGLRGLYVDAGERFASDAQREAWRDLTARRIGAPQHGRRIVLRAVDAWERRTPAHPGP